jgi:hypothetical protein
MFVMWYWCEYTISIFISCLVLYYVQNENPGPGTYKGYEQSNHEISPSYSKRGTGTFASKVQQLLDGISVWNVQVSV